MSRRPRPRRIRSSATSVPTPDPSDADDEDNKKETATQRKTLTLQVKDSLPRSTHRTLFSHVSLPNTSFPGNPGPSSIPNTLPNTRTRSGRNIPKTQSIRASNATGSSDAGSSDDYIPGGDGTRRVRATSAKSNRSAIPINNTSGIPKSVFPEELVETSIMESHNIIYNTYYKIFICKQCSCGVTFKSMPVHLKGQGRYYVLKDGLWAQELIVHSSGQKIDKHLMQTIAAELRALGHGGFEGTPETPAHPPDPIKGLHIFTNARKCTKCGQCFIQDSTFRNHHGVFHGVYTAPPDAPIVDAQSFFLGGDQKVLTLFAIKFLGTSAPESEPVIQENTSVQVAKLSPVDLMRRRKAGQLKTHVPLVQDALMQRIVLPYLQNSGIAKFLDKYKAEDLVNATIIPRMTIKEAPKLLLRLRHIVLLSFIQCCRKVSKATEAGRYPFGRADT